VVSVVISSSFLFFFNKNEDLSTGMTEWPLFYVVYCLLWQKCSGTWLNDLYTFFSMNIYHSNVELATCMWRIMSICF
jgi:hypothetical protein